MLYRKFTKMSLVGALRLEKRQVQRHNEKTNIQPINFSLGDFVLVRCAQKKGHKLQLSWRGPRRISKVISAWVFEVEDLNSSKKEIVHARRICFYQGKLDGEQVNPELLKYAEHSETI